VRRLGVGSASDGPAIVAAGGALGPSGVWTRMIADAIGRPVAWSSEPEATIRGAAVLALEALGALPDLAAARRPTGETFVPEKAHHVRYLEALERQRRLDERV